MGLGYQAPSLSTKEGFGSIISSINVLYQGLTCGFRITEHTQSKHLEGSLEICAAPLPDPAWIINLTISTWQIWCGDIWNISTSGVCVCDVENAFTYVKFMPFCCKIGFNATYALLSRNQIYGLLCGEKFNQTLRMWRNIARGTTDPGYWVHNLSKSFS